jgi:hypothetical protein
MLVHMSQRAIVVWAALVAAATTLGGLTGPAGLAGGAALSAVVLAATVLLAVRALAGVLPAGAAIGARTVSARARTRHVHPPRTTDPDAAGRPRPRAPGVPSLAH